MSLKITGRVIEILEEQSGTGRNGPWRKQEFIIETGDDYPAQICVVQWGDNIDKFAVEDGETLDVHIDLRSREYNGRWYTDVKAWKVERPEPSVTAGSGSEEPPLPSDDELEADLPF